MCKNKINNMEDKRLSKIDPNSNQNHLWLKQGWHKDAKSWLNNWGIKEDVTLITSKFKENLWCNREIEDKRKLRYYKEVINPYLENQKYLFVLITERKKTTLLK
jgi:hypothetical protein